MRVPREGGVEDRTGANVLTERNEGPEWDRQRDATRRVVMGVTQVSHTLYPNLVYGRFHLQGIIDVIDVLDATVKI
jgi:hypothetical protein